MLFCDGVGKASDKLRYGITKKYGITTSNSFFSKDKQAQNILFKIGLT